LPKSHLLILELVGISPRASCKNRPAAILAPRQAPLYCGVIYLEISSATKKRQGHAILGTFLQICLKLHIALPAAQE
jgi:hypothetical protein